MLIKQKTSMIVLAPIHIIFSLAHAVLANYSSAPHSKKCFLATKNFLKNSGSIEIAHEIFIMGLKFNKSSADGLKQIKDKNYAKKFKSQGLPITAVGLNVEML